MQALVVKALKRPYFFIRNSITTGDVRSIKAKKNIIISLLIKGISISSSLVLIPITIDYVNPTRYGIWLTLSSIVAWFDLFDMGFGNGLRNKFAESVAKGDHEKARAYVSTTYAILICIASLCMALFLVINPYVDWTKILNTPAGMAAELSLLVSVVFVFFCVQFVLQLLLTILTASQEPSKAAFLNFTGNLSALLVIYLLTKLTAGNLLYLAIAINCMPVLVLTSASIWFFRNEYRRYAPSFSHIRWGYARSLTSLGLQFFIIQTAAFVLYNTDNIVITQIFSPTEVTTFNIAYKLFAAVMMIFTIIVTPMWSIFTDAYTRKEFAWIKMTMSKIRKVWLGFCVFTLLILLASPVLFHLWMGPKVSIPFSLSAAFSLYIIIYCWHSIHVFFLNGIGKIRLQLILVVLVGLVNIPLAVFLGKQIGLEGIILANAILLGANAVCYTVQTNKIINRKAAGIWNR